MEKWVKDFDVREVVAQMREIWLSAKYSMNMRPTVHV